MLFNKTSRGRASRGVLQVRCELKFARAQSRLYAQGVVQVKTVSNVGSLKHIMLSSCEPGDRVSAMPRMVCTCAILTAVHGVDASWLRGRCIHSTAAHV